MVTKGNRETVGTTLSPKYYFLRAIKNKVLKSLHKNINAPTSIVSQNGRLPSAAKSFLLPLSPVFLIAVGTIGATFATLSLKTFFSFYKIQTGKTQYCKKNKEHRCHHYFIQSILPKSKH